MIEQVRAGTPLDAETVGRDDRLGHRVARQHDHHQLRASCCGAALGIFSALSNGISRAFDNAPRRSFLQDKLVGLLLMAHHRGAGGRARSSSGS